MKDFDSRNPTDNKLKDILPSEKIRRLHQKSWFRAWEGVFRAWLPIVGVFYFQHLLQGTAFWIFLPMGIFIIASRQHALAGLTHEAVHANLFKNRKWNDFLGSCFFAFPIFVSFARYKKLHMEHHRHLYTDKDPDALIYLRYPLLKKKFLSLLRKDFFAGTVLQNINYFSDLPRALKAKERVQLVYQDDKRAFYLFHLAILSVVVLSGNFLTYLVFWIVPYVSFLQVFLRIRGALEHGAVSSKLNPLLNTRSVSDHPAVLAFMAPLGLNYHLEHHLYPAVPWYQLKELHLCIEKSAASRVNFAVSYRDAVKNLIRDS